MKPANPMAGHSFATARKAFFGIVAAAPKVSAPLTERLKTQDSPVVEEPLRALARRLLWTCVESRKPRVDPPHWFDLVVDSQ
jgi:hypothetical protein